MKTTLFIVFLGNIYAPGWNQKKTVKGEKKEWQYGLIAFWFSLVLPNEVLKLSRIKIQGGFLSLTHPPPSLS